MATDGGFYACVEDYVKERGGNRPIKKILVANNGIGAVKAIRSMRKWAYETFGNERAVQFVAMATPEDLRANAEYIRMADEVVDVPGGNNSNNYANVMLIVEIAERWRVDAVWAGWGHASENPLLPDTLAATARKIVFIGPSGPPMRALGDKIGSTIIAQSAGVPTIAWNGDGLRADYADGGIPDDVYAKANVTTPAQAAEACERIGFPVMIKASEGGGGKGIRMVHEAEGVAAAYRQVASEVAGSPIFVMRLAPRSRHLEVQLLADTYGEAIALNGRDCSVQRRHQKIIEEGPAVVTSPEVWGDMERSAVQLAKKVGYCNAGTVEYLYSMDDQNFFFLELNPRLQVEHPVTEMITNVNLPAAQLQVAMGLPLHMIPDIRRMYGREPYGTDHIDFNSEERPPANGHCIAVRITAENPDQGFQPTSGTIKELNFRSTPDVWGYFSVDSSGLVHEFADSQFGHLFARGGDRETARRHMTVALKELSIRGDIRTTVEYIGEVLQSEDFITNRIDTGWLDVRIAAAKDGSLLATRMRKVDSHLAVVAGAVILAHEDVEKRTQTFLEMLGKGLLPPKELLVTSKAIDLIYEGVKYSLNCCQAGPRLFTVTTLKGGEGKFGGGGKALVEAQCRPLADGGYLLVIAGKSQVVYANQEASGLRLSVNGNTCVFTKEYDPACLDTDVAGKLARRVVADGARVKQGDAYCEVEVMKMYMPLCVRESGVVRWHLSEGAALKPGDRLATLELDDPSAVTRAEVFQGVLSPALTTLDSASSDGSLSQSGETSASATTADDAAAADAQAADDECSHALRGALLRHREALARADVRRVSFLSPREDSSESSSSILGVFTFRARGSEFLEDGLFRHIEPSHAFHLDLPRLSNFAIRPANTSQLQGGNMHVYMATPKESVGAGRGKGKAGGGTRYFARAASEVVGRGKRYFMEQMVLEALNGIDLALAEAEDACIRAGRKESLPPPSNNHIFVNAVAPDPEVVPQDVADHIRELMDRFQGKIQRLGVTQMEVKIVSGLGADAGGVLAPIRVVASNPTGYAVRVETYVEVSEGGKRVFRTLKDGGHADGHTAGGSANSGMTMKQGWDGLEVGMPYPVSLPFEDKRVLAQARSDTLYCFDFLELLEAGVQEQWAAYAKERPQVTSTPSMVLHSRELVVRRKGKADGPWTASQLDDLELVEVDRAAGLNDVGMVAWMLTLRTPEYSEGRQIVLIANDITHQAGSFGTREDVVFLLASRLSREKGLPRIYIAANSGARIGMAESLKKRFKVAWADPSDPTLGYRYLYLTREDYSAMKAKGAVACEEIFDEPSGETRFKILDVIGEEADLGVENLQGSGRIAGETSAAYSDVFTLTLVLGRTVGIGAYLVRLGQRTIQKASAAPILLTGYQALNTLMGREVYTSNEQLGGAGVMGPNGISHQLVDSHIGAVASALRWLSYVPSSRGSYLPVLDMAGVDDVNREVEFQPMKGVPCDPRHMIAGHDEGLDGSWTSGFFDKGSFTETLGGWAEAVVTGRARLGGIPVGIVATEGRLREKNCPADPADVSSHERIVQQAGGVWYPDSAHKTAQAIQDLNHEGLPLMVFANWRGFSGGQRDMFDEVLKYGALIVDALVEYKQPVFVYIPPHAELRGGAWVVVDSTVNANVMEMYAANGARGGVLEANGAASIKFRDRDLLKTAHRLDPVLMELDAKLAACTEEDEEDKRRISGSVAERETRVIGVYRQVAVQFADLHDTPGRMEARGAIRKVVPWSQSRSYFFWRLRRRLAEFDLRKQICRADPSVDSLAASALLKEWFQADGGAATSAGGGDAGWDWEEDKSVLAWMENEAGSIKGHMEQLKFGRVSAQVSELATFAPEAVLEGLLSAAGGLSKSARQDLIDRLSSSI